MKSFLALVFLLTSSILFAQIDTLKSPMMKVILKDSTVYYGRILSTEENKLIFTTKSGVEISIPKESILELYRMQDLPKEKPKVEKAVQPDEPQYKDRNANRLFLFSTAIPLSNGEGYISTNELFFPFVAFGFANIFSIGGGVSIFPSAESQIYYFSPKVTFFNKNNLSLGAGIFLMNNFGNNSYRNDLKSLAYFVGTLGDSLYNFTASLNFDISSDNKSKSTLPFLMIGVQAHIKKASKFIGEFWIPSSNNSFLDIPIFFFGFRFYNNTFSGDVGFIRPAAYSNRGFPFIPWISLTYNFTFIKKDI